MIDLHCHVLAGIDDGPETIEGSVALARAAANMGVRMLVATPHVSRRHPNHPETIERLASELTTRLAIEEIQLELRTGAEIAVSQLPAIDPSELHRLCLGGGPWLLLESPLSVNAPDMSPAVAALQHRGFGVVLAHPERCPAFQREPAALESLVRKGALTSITAGAFVGRFGRRVRAFAFELVRLGVVHSVASDAHDRSQRPPGMASELQLAELGALADWLTREVPAAILAGSQIPPRPAVELSGHSSRHRRWWRRASTHPRATTVR
jgi:protein-tyrosine phosphatase